MPETASGARECPHSIAVNTSVKGIVTVDAKLYYADDMDATAVLYRLRALLEEAARAFPTFALDSDLLPRAASPVREAVP